MESRNVTGFSAGLSVLLVDYDLTSLREVERMLQECNYKVVAVDHAVDAFAIIRDRRGEFDAVLIDLNMPPERDGLQLLKYIKHEFNLPVIMMSTDITDEAAETCLENGAYFFWKKPLSMRNIKYHLWKFIFMYKNAKTRAQKMKRKVHGLQKSSSTSKSSGSKSSGSKSSGSMSSMATDSISERKRNAPRRRRPKVNWTEELHSKFLKAIEIVGFDNAVPSKILELMKEPGLIRSQISSHLQKYRKYIKTQKQVINSMAQLTLNSKPTSGQPSPTSGQPSVGYNHEQGSGPCNQEQQRLHTGGVQQNLNLGESLLPNASSVGFNHEQGSGPCNQEQQRLHTGGVQQNLNLGESLLPNASSHLNRGNDFLFDFEWMDL